MVIVLYIYSLISFFKIKINVCVYVKKNVGKEIDPVVIVATGLIGIGEEEWRCRWRCSEFVSEPITPYNRNKKSINVHGLCHVTVAYASIVDSLLSLQF